MRELFLTNLDYIFFIYGISFFWMCFLLLPLVFNKDRNRRRGLGWLALFCAFHGINELLDMVSVVTGQSSPFSEIGLIFLVLSFSFLLEFGRLALPRRVQAVGGRWIHLVLLALVGLGALAGTAGINAVARLVLAVPSIFLAPYALLGLGHRSHGKSRWPLYIAAGAMCAYCLCAGVVVPRASFFPATVLNSDSFLKVSGIPIQLIRMLLVLVIAFALWEHFLDWLRKGQTHVDKRKIFMRRWLALSLLLMVGLSSFFVQLGGRFGRHFDEINHQARMDHAYDTLTAILEQGRSLATLLAVAPEARNAMQALPAAPKAEVDALLDRLVTILPRSSLAYLLDREGTAVASSNRKSADSLVGKSYSIRPYFQQALRGQRVRYMAMGLTTAEPGCYFSGPVLTEDGQIIGVAVIKVGLNAVETFAREPTPTFLLSDQSIVLISSRQDLVLRSMWPMAQGPLDSAVASRQFPAVVDKPILPAWTPPGHLTKFEDHTVKVIVRTISDTGWSLVQFQEERTEPWFRLVVMICCLLVSLLFMAFYTIYLEENERRWAIQESAAQYLAMFEKNLAVMMMSDPKNAQIVRVNEAARKFYGYSDKEWSTLRIFDIDVNRSAEGILHDILQTGGKHFEASHQLKSGQSRDVEVYASNVPLPDQNVIYSIIHDISERKRAEAERQIMQSQLIHAEKLASIGTLAAGVAHEINNPLAIVKGYTNALVRRRGSNDLMDNDKKTLETINSAIDRIASIVESLGSYARADTDLIEAVDIHKAISEVLAFVHQLTKSAGITLVQQLHPNVLWVRGNLGKIQQVLINLLNNAIDALKSRPNDRQIVIETSVHGQHMTILLRDNGCGIPADQIHKIFDPFFTTKPIGKGTGLGLAISHAIIQSFDGSLQVSSQEGEGSTFQVTLSCMEEKADEISRVAVPAMTAMTRLKGEILIVDDEPVLCALLAEQLTGAGLSVTTVIDAASALAILEKKTFEIVITDMQMPGMNGVELIQKARKIALQAKARYILLTGGLISEYSEEDQTFMREVVQGFVMKPWDLGKLLQLLKGLLAT